MGTSERAVSQLLQDGPASVALAERDHAGAKRLPGLFGGRLSQEIAAELDRDLRPGPVSR
jgi:hypothetical protein